MRLTLLAALTLCLPLAGGAIGGEGASTTYLNVRGGPGSGNPVVGGLAPGDVVQILRCNADAWCQIAGAGQEGWVASRFLTATPDAPEIDPRCRWELDIALAEPDYRAVCPAGVEPPPPPPPPGDLACFFARENYGGTRTCLEVGEYATLEADLDNSFNSVQIQGEARVRLCTETALQGICMDWLESATVLGARMEGAASSVKVYTGFLPPPPPPPPVVHSEGTVTLTLNARANLDTGAEGPAGADIWWRSLNGIPSVIPVNGAQMSLGDGSDRSLHICRAERFDEAPVTVATLTDGAVICLKTNLGRVGRVQAIEADTPGLTLAYVTWGDEE